MPKQSPEVMNGNGLTCHCGGTFAECSNWVGPFRVCETCRECRYECTRGNGQWILSPVKWPRSEEMPR